MRPALLLLAVALTACESGLPTNSVLEHAEASEDPRAFDGSCGECTFEPQLYTRQTGKPVTEMIEFTGHPDGAYILETDDFGDRGAESRLVLNGDTLRTARGLTQREVVLAHDNALHVRLTGKPGSRLRVRIFQEIASVDVTPAAARARIPATQQFTATARDRNGVEIPRVTFTWESADATIASIDAITGLAGSEGPRHETAAWTYTTTSPGTGDIPITARPEGREDISGSAVWSLVNGFVYTTRRPPRRRDDPRRAERPRPQPFSYDEARLQRLASRCDVEFNNERWWGALVGENQYSQCYPAMELFTPHRMVVLGVPVPGAPRPNVGLYGRYCGGGHPGGPSGATPSSFIDLARGGNYDPVDPIDAACMEHDRAAEGHDESGSSQQGACIVRYAIENESLTEEGAPIPEGSARWNAFWARWPDMAAAREHWLLWTRPLCTNNHYAQFVTARSVSME